MALTKRKPSESPVVPKGLSDERDSKIRQVIHNRQDNLTVVLENVHDIHNIHAILRTCDAVGISTVYVINTELPKVVKGGKRSSAGAKKWVSLEMYFSVTDCVQHLKSKGFKLYSTHLSDNSNSLYELDLTQKVALCLGNEQTGVSDELLALSDGNFIIPQFGMIESLNVSVAASVSLYEACRQRIVNNQYPNINQSQSDFDYLYRTLSWL